MSQHPELEADMYLTEVLARCSDIEQRMGRLYRLLAERFSTSESAAVWRELALEDETHADVLRREVKAFEEEDDSGGFVPEYAERIAHAEHALAELESRTSHLRTLDDATALAVALEQTALEDLYDDLVVQGSPAFKLLCERIEAALSQSPAWEVPGLPRRRRLTARKG